MKTQKKSLEKKSSSFGQQKSLANAGHKKNIRKNSDIREKENLKIFSTTNKTKGKKKVS
jgi:hypothetical protein